MIDIDDFLDDFKFEPEDVTSTTRVLTAIKEEKPVDTGNIVKRADFYSFIPKDQTILGLDISKASTGWCLIQNGVKTVGNITLTGKLAKTFSQHKELMYRVELKQELAFLFRGMHFDHIMIEDVFQGANAKTVRLLYDINTAIDELIYENIVYCKDFHRISNQVWKRWLFTIDTYDETKAMLDKPRIQACMAMIGIQEDGDGFQDRLDATGLIAGYFINEATKYKKERHKANFSFADIGIRYKATKEDATAIRNGVVKISDGPYDINVSTITKSTIEQNIRKNPDAVYVTSNKIPLGFLGANKKLKPIEGGGYLAFWVLPNKREKYYNKN